MISVIYIVYQFGIYRSLSIKTITIRHRGDNTAILAYFASTIIINLNLSSMAKIDAKAF
jgi:hypothetical protein